MSEPSPIEFILYFVGFLLSAEALRAIRSPRTRVIWRGLRLRHVASALLIIPLVVAAYLLITQLAPWTQWGWWSALGGQGSLLLGTPETSAAAPASRVVQIAPFVFVAAIFCFLPAAARREERWFRLGTERRDASRRAASALAFGLMHLLMGIPISAALALAVAGWMFQRVYLAGYARRASRHDALMSSTHVHQAYNLALVGLVAAGLGASLLR